MPDSPENKCPTCDGDGSAWCGLGINPHLAPCPACGGSGRVNTSGGEAGSREARNESRSSTTSGLIHTSPSVDPQCPDCGETIIGDWFGRKTEVPCGCSPVDSGTGTDENGDARIEGKTIACSDFVDDGYLLCLAFTDGSEAQIERESDRPITIRWTRASVPSSPHETGQKLPTSEEEFAAALLVSFEQWLADYDRRKREDFTKQQAELDRKYEALPAPLKARIDRFRAADPKFRMDAEAYEMAAVWDAPKIAEALRPEVDAGEDPEVVVNRFRDLSFEEQNAKVPGLDQGHSGNTFGGAVMLAYRLLAGLEC